MLEDLGYPDAYVGRRVLLHKDRMYEVNVFCEHPLVVGEVTLPLKDVEEARRELNKLMERAEVAERLTGKRAILKLLAVGSASSEVVEYLRKAAKEKGVRVAFGRELKLLT